MNSQSNQHAKTSFLAKLGLKKIHEGQITPEKVFFNRRSFVQSSLCLSALLALPKSIQAATAGFPSTRNPAFNNLEPTAEELVNSYNNFYEFGTDKGEVKNQVGKFVTEPWKVEIGGLVEKPITVDADQIVRWFGLEQRVYRLRCVETWAAVVPWDGFPLNKLLNRVRPLASAKYVAFTSFLDPEVAPGQKSLPYYPWPYTEGLRLDEAMHDLAFISTGMYGKPLPKQNGAAIRLVVPWKYGFKSIKSIVKISLVKDEPKTLWNALGPKEYGFYANVNPAVDHPRWSQRTEKPLGTWFGRQNTLQFNGYAEQVAALYQGMDLKKFF